MIVKESNAVRSCFLGDKRNGVLTGYRSYCSHQTSYACAVWFLLLIIKIFLFENNSHDLPYDNERPKYTATYTLKPTVVLIKSFVEANPLMSKWFAAPPTTVMVHRGFQAKTFTYICGCGALLFFL